MSTNTNNSSSKLILYRGKGDVVGKDSGLGTNSIGIANKLVASLGPNYSDNINVAKKFGKNIEKKELHNARVLELKNYNDILGLYTKYEKSLPAGLAKEIKKSNGTEQLKLIQSAGEKLREIIGKSHDVVKSPLAPADHNFLQSKGIVGNLYIFLGLTNDL